MDGEFSKGGEVSDRTAPLHLALGTHWERFQPVVAPKAAFPLILGLDWLRKHDPSVRWRSRVLAFTNPTCGAHCRKAAPKVQEMSHVEQAVLGKADLQVLPCEYRDLHGAFEEKECDKLSPHRKTDCAIELKL